MYYVTQKGGGARREASLLRLLGCCLFFGTLLFLMSHKEVWGRLGDVVFGCYLGLVMAHFVVDAGIWRMREPFQRAYLGRSFGFLFDPKA
jgi:hypothetical protein